MKKQRSITQITSNVYRDHSHQTFYLNKKTLTAYYINERLSGLIEILHHRWLSALIITAGLYAFFKGDYLLYIPILLLSFGVLELIYRKILNSCRLQVFSRMPEIKPASSAKNSIEGKQYMRKAIIFALLSVGLILSLIFEGNQGLSQFAIIGVAIFALAQSLLNVYWLFKSRT
jgi:hypothetical protein